MVIEEFLIIYGCVKVVELMPYSIRNGHIFSTKETLGKIT